MTTDEHKRICQECFERWLVRHPNVRTPGTCNPHCEGCEQYVENFGVLAEGELFANTTETWYQVR